MCDTRKRQAGTEIEITPAMIEAGADELASALETVDCIVLGDERDLVARVFRVMLKARLAESA